MNTLYLIRGLPGSGKSTLAAKLVGQNNCFEADDFFINGDGEYHFKPEYIGDAHEECRADVVEALVANEGDVAVANTFAKAWEAAFYFEAAAEHDYQVVVIMCQSSFGSVHGVPAEAVQRMAENWEASISPNQKEVV